MQRILQHVKPERRNKEFERNPAHPIFWKRSFHFETVEQFITFFIPALVPILKLSGLYNRGFQNTLNLTKTKITIVDSNLPKAFDGFQILFLSDIHIDGNDYLLEPLCAMLDTVEVDVCLLGGDYRFRVHGQFRKVMDRFQEMIPYIHSKQGIFGILGNHDSWEMIKPLERLGITMLINESVEIKVGTDRIWILGLDDPHYYECDDYHKANQGVPENCFRLLLVHTTGSLSKLVSQPINLYLCGHTHAGQISFPVIGPPITHSRLKGKYIYGRWQYNQIKGYTSSGVGTSGIPVRYRTRSEIVVITLQSSNGDIKHQELQEHQEE
jgi:predicted MPP superfamily phosphohydrolase